MERYKMVEIEKVLQSEFQIVESNNYIEQKFDSFVDKFGAFKVIVVCERPNGYYKIIDGNKAFESYKKNNIKKVLCFNLGELSFEYEVGYKILLNAHFERLNYISISEMISKVCSNNHESVKLSHISGLSIKEVDRYKDLINFDWDDFLNQKSIGDNQMDIFNFIEE
jgi:hypothetical protein